MNTENRKVQFRQGIRRKERNAERLVVGASESELLVLKIMCSVSPRFGEVSRKQIARLARLIGLGTVETHAAIDNLVQNEILTMHKGLTRIKRPKLGQGKRNHACRLYGERCVFCDRAIERDELTLDHLIPKSRGGSNGIGNLAPCCYKCNQAKGARTPNEWARDILGYRRKSWTSYLKVAATLLFVRLGF